MTITFAEAVRALKTGRVLAWESSGAFNSGTIHLTTPEQRRIFDVLIKADRDLVEDADESLFSLLTQTWNDEESDPANSEAAISDITSTGPWRLIHIEATGFGGLNMPGGPAFELDVNADSWCIEGYNGSGKTSLTSLILWTLTGYCSREHDGPYKDEGHREPVRNASGKKIGCWPPLVSYPLNAEGLKTDAIVTAKLTFRNPAGEFATAERKTTSPVAGVPVLNSQIDPRLLSAPELIESGLLMPARIGHIGFGPKSQTLYGALKMLTGLDQLSCLATGAATLTHKGRKFLKYAKDNGAEGYSRDFVHAMTTAKELACETKLDLSKDYKLGDENLAQDLTDLETWSTTQAGEALGVLKAEISPSLDLTKTDDRTRLNDAVFAVRRLVRDGTKVIPLFIACAAMKKARIESCFKTVDSALDEALQSLEIALEWHTKQEEDEKLQLKALASKYFISDELLNENAYCPLCDTILTSEKQQVLAADLAALKGDADQAARSINDACTDIEKSLRAYIPEYLALHLKTLSEMIVSTAFRESIKERFANGDPFQNELTGISVFATKYADDILDKLPDFEAAIEPLPKSNIEAVGSVRDLIMQMLIVSKLAIWLEANREPYVQAWKALIGIADEDGTWPDASIEGKLGTLEAAIAASEPLDKIAKQLCKAKSAVSEWTKINEVQLIRENIAEAIEPLKQLRDLVNSETHRTVITLSDRVDEILKDIRLRDRFTFENTTMTTKWVTVEGSFADGLKIDASLVANSSWLRALLWAFIFALREQTIDDSGTNNFPLMVLDDPQTTFDPKNKMLWAQKMVAMSNLDENDPQRLQLFLTTHERQFHDMISMTNKFKGEHAEMSGPSSSMQVAHIVNGTFLGRRFNKASIDQNDELGYEYIQSVRVYCEDLLRIMLRSESYEIMGDSLGKLCDVIRNLRAKHIDPFNRAVFLKLVNLLNENKNIEMGFINLTHHKYDGNIGYAQAEQVQAFWEKHLHLAFTNAFQLAADYDAYGGVSRFNDWPDNVVAFPAGHNKRVKALEFKSTGVAAAAETDGQTGNGQIELEQFGEPKKITLFNHEAYRLNAATLDPVARIGDVVLVQCYGVPRSRNLTVAAYGNKLYARRMTESADNDNVILSGQATNPYELPDTVITLAGRADLQKIIGTIFMPSSAKPPVADGHEVTPIDDFSQIETRVKNVCLLKVKGASMEPIALDGQHVMTQEAALDLFTLKALNGELVIAVDEDARVYFKRLRLHGKLIVLESANSSMNTSSEILSLSAGSDYPLLKSLKSVVGVLFDQP